MFAKRIRPFTEPAFSLIELLIVVAIIAILAAIAVPNFMDAQVRSKVSASKTNMRSLGVAVSSYWIDWNQGPLCPLYAWITTNDLWGADNSRYWNKALTTPVGYITKFPTTPFQKMFWEVVLINGTTVSKVFCEDNGKGRAFYWFGNLDLAGKNAVPQYIKDPTNTAPNYRAAVQCSNKGYKWFFLDCGPGITPWDGRSMVFGSMASLGLAVPSGSAGAKNWQIGASKFASYDPTNGTRSLGYLCYTNKGFYTIDNSSDW